MCECFSWYKQASRNCFFFGIHKLAILFFMFELLFFRNSQVSHFLFLCVNFFLIYTSWDHSFFVFELFFFFGIHKLAIFFFMCELFSLDMHKLVIVFFYRDSQVSQCSNFFFGIHKLAIFFLCVNFFLDMHKLAILFFMFDLIFFGFTS